MCDVCLTFTSFSPGMWSQPPFSRFKVEPGSVWCTWAEAVHKGWFRSWQAAVLQPGEQHCSSASTSHVSACAMDEPRAPPRSVPTEKPVGSVPYRIELKSAPLRTDGLAAKELPAVLRPRRMSLEVTEAPSPVSVGSLCSLYGLV